MEIVRFESYKNGSGCLKVRKNTVYVLFKIKIRFRSVLNPSLYKMVYLVIVLFH